MKRVNGTLCAALLASGLTACKNISPTRDLGDYVCKVVQDTIVSHDKHLLQPFKTDENLVSVFPNYSTVLRLQNSINQDGNLEIYFPTGDEYGFPYRHTAYGGMKLDQGDKRDLDMLIKQLNESSDDAMQVVVGSHIIHREFPLSHIGDEEIVQLSGNMRIRNVEKYLKAGAEQAISTTIASYGRVEPQNSNLSGIRYEKSCRPWEEGKIEISFAHIITWLLQKTPADVYVLDAGGSMYKNWDTISAYPFPKGSDIYTFTTENDSCASNLEEQEVSGETPLLESVMNVISTGKYDGKTMTILSSWPDYKSDYTVSDILSLAREKNITFNVVGVGIADRSILRTLSDETGGTYAFQSYKDCYNCSN